MNKINPISVYWHSIEETHKSSSFEQLPEKECIVGWYSDCWADEEDEMEANGIIIPLTYFYPESFDFSVEELPESLDVVGYYPDQDEGIA
jgi:hypothetical protein